VARSQRFGRSRFTLILLVLASLTVLTLDYRDSGPVKDAKEGIGSVFGPVRDVADTIASPFRNAWKGIFEYDDLEDENTDLRRELDKVKGDRVEAAAEREELEALKRLADLPVTEDIDRVTAQVVSGPLTSFDSTIEINKGSGDGIKKGMPVITEAGLVGRVLFVRGGRSRVQLITDPDFSGLGVKLVESGDVGKATGGTEGNLEVNDGIRPQTPVERGEDVVTSGFDERSSYPGNIPVGTVLSVGLSADRTQQTLVLEPAVDLEGLSYVVVLLCDEGCA
jgi:rod shape-determining protein MreC